MWPFKPKRCERCQRVEKKLHAFQRFQNKWQQGYGGGGTPILTEKMKVCKACLLQTTEDFFRGYRGRAVVIKPHSRYSGYSFYSMASLPLLNYSEDHIRAVQEMLPTSSTCERCRGTGMLRYVDHDMYAKPQDASANGFKIPKDPGKVLCGSCLAPDICEHLRNSTSCQLTVLVPQGELQEGIWASDET